MNVSSPCSSEASEVLHRYSEEKGKDFVTLTERLELTKKQYDVLKVVCDTYQKSISEYMHEALVEVMRSDIEEGNFCDALLDKLDGDDPNEEKRINISSSPPTKDDIDNLQF